MMAWLASGNALVTMAARVTVLLVMVPLAPATMVARVTALLVMVSLAPALAPLLAPLLPPALVLAGTRARRPEQLTTRRTRPRDEASGLVRGHRQQQQLPRLRGAVAVAAA